MNEDKDVARSMRNRARRDRYAMDPDYRDRMVQDTRDRYRRKVGLKPRRSARDFDLRRIGRWCQREDVRWSGGRVMKNKLVMDTRTLATILGRKPDVVRRWIDRCMVPPPIALIKHHREGCGMVSVYLMEEAREIIKIMRNHQEETPYFRVDHYHTVDALNWALYSVRESL